MGWKRDFIWECDGWTKDGNPNTRFSKTVLPLPYHDLENYDQPPGRLEDDPVYRNSRRTGRNTTRGLRDAGGFRAGAA